MIRKPGICLSKKDLADSMPLSHRPMQCQSRKKFKTLVLALKRQICFELALCAQSNIREIVRALPHPKITTVNFNYPTPALASMFMIKDDWTYGSITVSTMNRSALLPGRPYAENNSRTRNVLEYIIPFFALTYEGINGKDTPFTRN